MIKCLVCKKYIEESYFVDLRYGGLAICIDCSDSEEAKKLNKESDERINQQIQKQLVYEKEKRNRIKNQQYEGQYDWM